MKQFAIRLLTFIASLGTKIGLNKLLIVKFIYGNIMSFLGKHMGIELVDTKFGFKMYMSKGGLVVEKKIKETGIWEEEITKIIIDNLKEGDIFIDVGSNIGRFTLLASSKVGDKGKVIAFEPSKYNYDILEKNIKLNNCDNVKIIKKGLGSKKIKKMIHYVPSNPGHSSILEDERNKFFDKEEIELNTMDNELKNIKKISLIKIDVEGYEYEVFLGMLDIIKKYHPKIILEYTPEFYQQIYKKGEKFNVEFLGKFLDLGYTIYHVNEFSLRGDFYKKDLLVKIKKNDINGYLSEIKQSNILLKYE